MGSIIKYMNIHSQEKNAENKNGANRGTASSARTQSENNEVTLSKGLSLLLIMRYEDGGHWESAGRYFGARI